MFCLFIMKINNFFLFGAKVTPQRPKVDGIFKKWTEYMSYIKVQTTLNRTL